MRYTHLLFDADNTLFDFDRSEERALTLLGEDVGYKHTPELTALYHRINDDWWKRLERQETTLDELPEGRFRDFVRAAGIDRDPAQMNRLYRSHLSECCIMMPDAQEVITELSGDCELYIITNGLSDVQHGRFDHSPIAHCIRRMFISQELGVSKPHREYFDKVLAAIGQVDRSRILVIGDSLTSDIAGGIAAGLDTCWVSIRGGDAGALRPTYTVSSLRDVIAIARGDM